MYVVLQPALTSECSDEKRSGRSKKGIALERRRQSK